MAVVSIGDVAEDNGDAVFQHRRVISQRLRGRDAAEAGEASDWFPLRSDEIAGVMAGATYLWPYKADSRYTHPAHR